MISFFVSSTFQDMQGERDILHNIVLPKIRETALSYGENAEFVDLRWGISTQDMDTASSANQILNVCLGEIKNCKPYMIVLLGERYGWMPNASMISSTAREKGLSLSTEQISITELEIQYGIALNEGNLDHCIFCIRKPLPIGQMPASLHPIYASQTAVDIQRMKQLKEKIQTNPTAIVLEYELSWDEASYRLTGYEDFAAQLTDALLLQLKQTTLKKQSVFWQETQRKLDQICQLEHLRRFIGRDALLQQLLSDSRNNQILILTGTSGCGKSALMSRMQQQLEQQGTKSYLIFCGNSSYCNTVTQLLGVLCWLLSHTVTDADTTGSEPTALLQQQTHWYALAKQYEGAPVVFLIDGIDLLSRDAALFASVFLPPALSKKIRFVITTTEDVPVSTLALSYVSSFKNRRLMPPTTSERQEIIYGMFAATHKQAPDKLVKTLLQKQFSENMLALEMIIQQLSTLTQNDFQNIAHLEKDTGLSSEDAIATYLVQFASQMPDSPLQMINNYLYLVDHTLEHKGDSILNPLILSILACTTQGMTRNELADFSDFLKTDCTASLPVENPWLHWWNELSFSNYKRYLSHYLVEHQDGHNDFTHHLIRQALCKQQPDVNRANAQLLCDYLNVLPLDDPFFLANVFPLIRQVGTPEKENRSFYNIMLEDTLETINNMIATTTGEEQLLWMQHRQTLIDSVLSDLAGDDGYEHLCTYCDLISIIVTQSHRPSAPILDFFIQDIANTLRDQGEQHKAYALQIYLCCIRALTPEESYREQIPSWEKESDLLQLAHYFSEALSLFGELEYSLYKQTVAISLYQFQPDSLFNIGTFLFKDCLRKRPKSCHMHFALSQFYIEMACIETLHANFSILVSRYVNMCIQHLEDGVALVTTDALREQTYAPILSISAQLSKSLFLLSSYSVFHGKKWRLQNEQILSEADPLLSHLDPVKDLHIRCQMEINYANLLIQQHKEQKATTRLWQYYRRTWSFIMDETHPENCTPFRRMQLTEVAVKLGELAIFGGAVRARSQNLTNAGLISSLLDREERFIQANLSHDFTSRYHYAILLMLKLKYPKSDAGTDLKAICTEVLALLNELRTEKKRHYASVETPLSLLEDFIRGVEAMVKK